MPVVEAELFECPLAPDAVLYAAPCRSQAGQRDLALSLPSRAGGDERIRIGLVHGSTFDIDGCQMNFPIVRDAAIQRGLDYLAIGDTHSFREVPPGARPPTVYPSAPEPTCFGETDAGYVAVVFVTRQRRAIIQREPVAQWVWEEVSCRSLAELRALRNGADRRRHVLRLAVDMCLPAAEYEEAEAILRELKGTDALRGRVGIMHVDRSRLVLDTRNIEDAFPDLPDVLRVAAECLKAMEKGEQAKVARQALMHHYRSVREASWHMRLIRITVDTFQCIEHPEVDLGPRLNVLYGPNDLGKSSLAAAIRTVLLLPHGSAAYEQLLSWHSASGGRGQRSRKRQVGWPRSHAAAHASFTASAGPEWTQRSTPPSTTVAPSGKLCPSATVMRSGPREDATAERHGRPSDKR